jgi:biopolymer transport protein ExbD
VKFNRHVKVLAGRLDAVPFVNVMLLLLLFFLIATRFVQEPGVSIQLPETATNIGTPAPLQPPLIVTVTAENPETRAHTIFFNDEIVDLARLEAQLAEAARRSPRRECVVRADQRVPHGLVVTILGLAERAGLKTVRLATQPPQPPTPRRAP